LLSNKEITRVKPLIKGPKSMPQYFLIPILTFTAYFWTLLWMILNNRTFFTLNIHIFFLFLKTFPSRVFSHTIFDLSLSAFGISFVFSNSLVPLKYFLAHSKSQKLCTAFNFYCRKSPGQILIFRIEGLPNLRSGQEEAK